jgi:hypothetical protein
MPDDRERLHELLLPWLDRHSLGTRPDLPVVLLWAPRGSGTEDVLAHVAGRQDLPSPVASIDGRALATDMRPHEVALFSMWPLGKHIRGFGRIRFPRFLLGLAAIRGPVASLPQAARAQVVATVLGDATRLRTWLGQLLRAVAESAGAGGHAADLAGQTMEGLLEAARELQRRRSTPVAWYREGLGEPFADPFQALAQLGRSEAQGEHALVDVTLCRAFLADIRAEYQAEFRWYARERNPLLLIDAATRRSPARFVEHLVAAGGPAPLVVVAASGTRQSPPAGEPSGWQPAALADASATDWATHSGRPGWARHYPVVFGIPTAAPRPAGLPRPGARRHEHHVEFAQRLTAGHPGGYERVLRIARAGTDLRRGGAALGRRRSAAHRAADGRAAGPAAGPRAGAVGAGPERRGERPGAHHALPPRGHVGPAGRGGRPDIASLRPARPRAPARAGRGGRARLAALARDAAR